MITDLKANPTLADANPGNILLFTRPRRGRDYVIKWVTHSPFYHVAIYEGHGKVIEARLLVVATHSLLGREEGVVVVPAPSGLGSAALASAHRHLGDKFDKLDLVIVLMEHLIAHLHIPYVPHGKLSCAELVAKSYKEAGVNLFPDKPLDEVVPGDFARLLKGNTVSHAANRAMDRSTE